MKKAGVAVIMACASLTLMVGGCKKAAEKAAEKAIEAGIAKESGGKANVDLSGGKVTIQTKDGTATYSGGKDAKLPDNFPKDIYVPEGASIMASSSAPGGFTVSLESKDAAEKLLSALKSKMTASGWKEEATFNQGKTSMISYKQGERAVNFSVDSQEKTTVMTIVVSTGK
ncbi:MAG TPA: hypothetical protein HPP76_12690 [Desulfuromonadales bacterium]|nr:hypothetical protein [Desulfuromonadales bacterium]